MDWFFSLVYFHVLGAVGHIHMKGHNNQFACLVNVKPPWFEADANLVDVLQMNAQLVGGKPKLEKVQSKLNLHFVHFSPLWLNAFRKLVSMVRKVTTSSGTICLKSENYV
jgi:hypothetical protein